MKNLPKPNQLKMFQSIIEHGSFRAAAKSLNQTQPALTQSMNDLEKMLGTSLMIRGPRGVVLTEAGKLFETRVQLILKELERAVTEAKQLSAVSRGSLEIGSSSLPFFTMLPSAIKRFQSRFPQINVNLTEGPVSDLLPLLRAGKLDFIIGTSISENALTNEFVEEPFFTVPCGVLARSGHPLAQSTSLSQLKNGKWYLPTSKAGHYSQLEKVLFPEGRQPEQTVIRGDTAIMAVQMMLRADFLTVAAKEILQVPYLSTQLCMLPIEEPLPEASYNFIYPRRLPLTQIARTMMDKLKRECIDYPWHNEVESAPML
ncbi:LysR substrate-binding domain-containing protein [Serratia fonticola]|uniref:LysR substrate-binding domain-containing protein n=1 Tax=Serratia fonticola TaxID=47917 RepID=A0ABY9PTC7_SERFO|nr:LysR substrate-binding domain-containing protein [Serratia fonticola]WMT16656.1 LysR substrate-binding domain-containing protein [Serratia fonticola]